MILFLEDETLETRGSTLQGAHLDDVILGADAARLECVNGGRQLSDILRGEEVCVLGFAPFPVLGFPVGGVVNYGQGNNLTLRP